MLFITERKTTQTDHRFGTVLNMVSLFVVAYDHEVEKFQEDNFVSFLTDARSKGYLVLDGNLENYENVEVSRTRKGFLIKVWTLTNPLTTTEVDPLTVAVAIED